MRRAVDVAVAGAGIIGCAIAWECARRGASVLLLDRGEPGAKASSAAAGMLAPASESAEAGPFLELGMSSLALWPTFAAGVEEDGGVSCGLALDGVLRIAWDGGDAERVRGRLDWQRAAGAEAKWLDADAVEETEPAFTGPAAGAAWFPAEGRVDSRAAVAALLAALRERGVEIRAGVTVERGGAGDAVRVQGDAQPLAAQTIVVAAGAWSGRLLRPWDGVHLGVRPLRGQLLCLSGLPAAPRRVLYGGHLGYAVGRPDGTVLVGATEDDAGFDVEPTAEATERLRVEARRLVRGADEATDVSPWTGLRPGTPDGLPLLGELETAAQGSRYVVATGHHRNGVLLAPATAQGIASLVLDGRAPAGWAPFSPGRKPA